MKVNTLKNPQINQNGYHRNTLTKERIGTLFIYPIDYTPEDCLSCDGYSLQINDYEELYKIIGIKFNQSGDETGTFRVPDYNITKRFLQPGDGAGALIAASLPQHSHSGTTSSNGAHTHTAQSAGSHNHRPITDGKAVFNGLGGGGGGRGWYQSGDSGYTSTDGAHTHTTTSNGAHTHTITVGNASNSIYKESSTVQPPSQLVHVCIKYK